MIAVKRPASKSTSRRRGPAPRCHRSRRPCVACSARAAAVVGAAGVGEVIVIRADRTRLATQRTWGLSLRRPGSAPDRANGRLGGAAPVHSGAVTCPSCHADVPAGARFCAECGQDLRLRGDERRIVTVLFADLVGYTTLSETPRPRAREEPRRRVLRAARRRHRRLRRPGRQDHRRRHRRPVRRADRPRGRRRAGRAGRAADAGDAGGHAAELGVDIRMRVGVNTGEVLVGRAARRRRLHRDGRRGEHRQPPADRGRARRGARRARDLRGHAAGRPLRGAGADRRQGARGARAGVAGRRRGGAARATGPSATGPR